METCSPWCAPADGDVVGLNASGRAGSGADPDAMRAERLATMPLRHDIRTVTVPGCVDGWIALHGRFGALDLATVLTPAIRLAAAGFPASPLLVGSLSALDDAGREQLHELADQATATGVKVRRPGVALTLQAIVAGGRGGFYDGAFGGGLLDIGGGLFTADDLAAEQRRVGRAVAGARARASTWRRSGRTRRATSPSAWPGWRRRRASRRTPTTRRGPTS